MVKETPKISDAEWEVMKAIWEKSPQTSSEIIEKTKPATKWSPKTIHTLIGRLVNKGALGVNKETQLYTYYPLVSEEKCKKEETRNFLKKVYDGSLNLLLVNFIKDEDLSSKEIEELKALLEDKDK